MGNRISKLTGFAGRLRGGFPESDRLNAAIRLFAIEGVLIALVNNIVNNNNYLFATRMGANDFQISLVASLPQLVGMLVLIPGGILTDRMPNKRRMVITTLFLLLAAYFIMAFTPFFEGYRLVAFIGMLTLSMGPMTLYGTSWQAYFSDVVPIEERNRAFTLRTKGTFFVSILIPLVTGPLLASVAANEGKIRMHQAFVWFACALLVIQVLTLKRISGGNVHSGSGISFKDLKAAAVDLSHNRRFLGFAGVALLFYLMWQSDWTLYYLGQINYLKMNETWLSYVNVGGALVQFLTIGFWSRVNEKMGVRFGIIFGSLGLAFCPISMIVSTSLPHSAGPLVFLIMNTLSNFAFATVALNILQCLLQVVPEKNKTLSIAIYTVLITFSNAVMPVVGVQIYTAFGADLRALHITFWILFSARIVTTSLWTLRWWLLRHELKI